MVKSKDFLGFMDVLKKYFLDQRIVLCLNLAVTTEVGRGDGGDF
jgi:hypothetical protein